MLPLIRTLSLQVTYQCNIACRHCGPYCDPHQKEWMTTEEIKDLIRQAAEMGVLSVVFTGGEPTLLKKELPKLFRYIRDDMKIPNCRIVSNGRFATSYEKAKKLMAEWQEAGLKEVNFSCGEYHQEFVPIEYVANAYRAGRDLGYQTVLLAGEFLANGLGKMKPEMYEEAVGMPLMAPDETSPYSKRRCGMSRGHAMRYGRGKTEVPIEGIEYIPEAQIKSVCDDVNSVITAHPNGNTTACCGIMVRDESLLNIGNWRTTPMREIVEQAHDDLILNWIRHRGLKDMKRWLETKDPNLGLRDKYQNICDLCAEIVYNPRCQELLVQHAHEKREEILASKIAMDVMTSPDFVYSTPKKNEQQSQPAT
jgi:radical SAM family protein/4Fe-4S single cluster protein